MTMLGSIVNFVHVLTASPFRVKGGVKLESYRDISLLACAFLSSDD